VGQDQILDAGGIHAQQAQAVGGGAQPLAPAPTACACWAWMPPASRIWS